MSGHLQPIKLDSYKPLRELVCENIRQAIIDGTFSPGERLMEIQLADEMGVSRTPVRPGNLGTIIRICDWFGVRQIIASPACADVFNAKTVQASMGSISRVRVFYRNLVDFIGLYQEIPVAGLLLDGNNIYSSPLPKPCFIVMGNEGNGITAEIRKLLTLRLLIPSYPSGVPTAESLNVAMATGITLSEFRRREI